MIWRDPTAEDHRAVSRQIRGSAVFNCMLLGFVIVGCIFSEIMSVMEFLRDGYPVPALVIIQLLMIGMVVFILFMMRDFIRRFKHVLKKEYEVADCFITSKRKELGYRSSHHYVMVSFASTEQEELFTEADVYYDAQIGSLGLVVRYIEKDPRVKAMQDDLVLKVKE